MENLFQYSQLTRKMYGGGEQTNKEIYIFFNNQDGGTSKNSGMSWMLRLVLQSETEMILASSSPR